MLLSEKVGLMVWGPLVGGLLSRKYDLGKDEDHDNIQGQGRRANFDLPPVLRPRARAVFTAPREIAGEKGCTVAQVALEWLFHQSVVTSVIVGAKRPDQLAGNLGAIDLELSGPIWTSSVAPVRYPANIPAG